ncbi:hypothetical protein BJ170DRAFT_459895 [Xylariales sp. AK1849]|nr:hypothetical protein BJ170DRAFT_459895 [Xylariales sp. AK1849]
MAVILAFFDFSSWQNDAFQFIQHWWSEFIVWLSQPQVYYVLIVWAITFTLICTLLLIVLLILGFGPRGIVAGTFAAAFQSYMYGGFTPAGGLFATLTSLAMLGFLVPAIALTAAFVATGVAAIAWACQYRQ